MYGQAESLGNIKTKHDLWVNMHDCSKFLFYFSYNFFNIDNIYKLSLVSLKIIFVKTASNANLKANKERVIWEKDKIWES